MRKQYIQALQAITITIGIYFFPGVDAHAQQAWNLQLEPMYMGVAGTDKHLANITTTTTTSTPLIYLPSTPPTIIAYPTFTSTDVSTSKNFDMNGNGTFRGQLEYMPEDWGVGISGWWFDTEDSINLNLNSAALLPPSFSQVTTDSTVAYSSNNFYVTAPPANSGSVLQTSASSSFGVWNVDAYGIKNFGEFEHGRINMTFGAKFGSIDNETSEAFNRGPSGIFTSGSAANSANASFLVGPSIGVQGFGKYGNHRLEGFLSQSVLIGNVDYKTVTNRQSSYTVISFLGSSYNYLFNDSVNLSDSETIAIPVTEMKIKYLYDLTENLSVGLGFFGSAWVDTPTVPGAQFDDRQYKTLFFYGGLASIDLRY